MDRGWKRKLAIGGIAALAVAGAGGAIAATQLSPKEEQDAIVEDAAKRLGVEPDQLSDALRQALEARVDKAVADGLLTEEQGSRLKEAIESGDLPILGMPFGKHGFGHHGGPHMGLMFGGLDTAAEYLGVSEGDLRTELRDGKTLADVAKEKGKSVDGLADALVKASEERIAKAVEDGKLTQEQADKLKEGLRDRVTALVNGEGPPMGFRHRFGPGGKPPFGGDRGSEDGASDEASFDAAA
jgi:uncharacterized protein YidB (DUF937 family)